jgi:transaldolase
MGSSEMRIVLDTVHPGELRQAVRWDTPSDVTPNPTEVASGAVAVRDRVVAQRVGTRAWTT